MAASEIFESVTFSPDFDPSTFEYSSVTGFYVDSSEVASRGLTRVVGFGVPLASEGGFDQSDVVHPLVDFGQLPPEHQTPARQGKGVGTRVYSKPEAPLGHPGRLPDRLGAYAFNIDPKGILDLRERGKLETVLRTAWVIGNSLVPGGLERTVERTHESYEREHKSRGGTGHPQAILMGQPPRARARQGMRGGGFTVPSAFMIVRDPNIELRKVGSYTRDDLR